MKEDETKDEGEWCEGTIKGEMENVKGEGRGKGGRGRRGEEKVNKLW